MIRLYWPGKPVPQWLNKITFSGTSDGTLPRFHHAGFGVIVKRDGIFHVWGLSGTFIVIHGAGMELKVEGQGRGVHYHHTSAITMWRRS